MEYNILAAIENDYLPVMSFVIYLRDVGEVQRSPLVVTFPYGDEIIRFHYKYIELHKLPADALLNMDIVGLLPLVLLTQGGTEPPVVEEVIERLTVSQEKELLTTTYSLGGLAFTSDSGREWFRKRFKMLQDTMRDNWVFQEIGQEYMAKGLEQGFKRGEQQAYQREVQRHREKLLEVVWLRFPRLARLAKIRLGRWMT